MRQKDSKILVEELHQAIQIKTFSTSFMSKQNIPQDSGKPSWNLS